jgi:hypothetical protein
MKLNVVLDLDRTLLLTHPDKDSSENEGGEDPKAKYNNLKLFSSAKNKSLRNKVYVVTMYNLTGDCTGQDDKMYGVYRPYLQEFLDFLDEECDNVIVWTAGIRSYGYAITQNIFLKSKKKPILVYTKINRGYEFESSVKPLRDLYNDPICKEKGITSKNTIIIDDNPDTFIRNKDNALFISEFDCDIKKKDILEHEDDDLLKAIRWMQTKVVRECTDIRKVNKENVFKTSIEEYDELLLKEN